MDGWINGWCLLWFFVCEYPGSFVFFSFFIYILSYVMNGMDDVF